MNDGRGGTGRWRGELTDLILGRGTVARVGGVRVSLHWMLPPFVAALILVRGGAYDHWPWAIAEILGLYAVVLLPHEVGHVLAGWSLWLDVREVVLWPLGGLAISAPPLTWRGELWLAAAGPLVNLLLVPLLFGAWYELGYYRGGDVSQLLWVWAWANVLVLGFNALPIWPLDGGTDAPRGPVGRTGKDSGVGGRRRGRRAARGGAGVGVDPLREPNHARVRRPARLGQTRDICGGRSGRCVTSNGTATSARVRTAAGRGCTGG